MRLKELRVKRKISQLKLAMDLGMNQNSISRYENETRQADYDTLIKLADYFYIAAMEKFKYFLVNGHADTMKEAVKLYDEYLHREKLEFEATRTADEAKRAVDM